MSIDRQQVAFSGNERVDLPDVQQLIQDAQDDLRRLVANYVDDTSCRILKNYVPTETQTGLNFTIRTDLERGFHDINQQWVVKSPDANGSTVSVPMAANSTNYVFVYANVFTDNPQPRAFWDVDIGLTGGEFFDTINIRQRIDEGFGSTTSGFPGGLDVALFIVTTNLTEITGVDASPQDLLWEPRSFSIPAAPNRSTVYSMIHDLRSFIDGLGALVGEAKGTGSTLETVPWASLKLLKEYQNLFIGPEVLVTFEGTYGTNMLNWAANLEINIAGRSGPYIVPTQTITILDQQCAYVSIPEGPPSGNLTVMVADLSTVPINPSYGAAQDQKIQVLFFRNGGTVFGIPDIPPLESGESETIGQDLSTVIRARLGITGEITFEAYTSDEIIDLTDTYPEAISKLDAQMGAILNNNPAEAYWTGDGSTVTFDISTAAVTPATFTWSSDNTKPDITVEVDGRKLPLDPTLSNGGYKKLTTTSIQLAGAPDGPVGGESGSLITVRKEGTATAGIPPSDTDLWSTPVDANIVPNAPNTWDCGSSANPFLAGYFTTVYCQNVVYTDTIGDVESVKMKINGSGSTLAAGKIVALYSDGKVYPANADAATGQVQVGIAIENISPTQLGRVLLFGPNAPGVLAGLGFVPGKEVFIDSTGAYVQQGSGSFDSSSVIARVGWSDCADGGASTTVTDLIVAYQEIASP